MTQMKHPNWYSPLIALFLFTSASLGIKTSDDDITSEDIIAHIKYLASDELGGRFPGTKGDSLAEDYVINEFRKYDLKPMGEDGYREHFDFISEIKMGTNNVLMITGGDKILGYTAGADFNPLGISSVGSAEGDIVFAGYGISAPDLNYDDLKSIDLKDKIALILRFSPGYNTPHDNPFNKYELTRRKAANLKKAGAKAIIVVAGPLQQDEDDLMKISAGMGSDNIGIPIINIKRSIAEKIFSRESNDNLNTIQRQIDSLRIPNSFNIKNSRVNIQTDLNYIKSYTANVLGYLEGSDPILKNETIVIGAHMDHLGDGMKYGSLYEKHEPAIHNGADDNASGDAGILEIAQKMASERSKFKRSYLFMLFSGEEAGLLGSGYFTKSDLFNKLNIVTMINMDMIGRMVDDKLIVNGTGTSSVWPSMLDSLNQSFQFNLSKKEEGFGPSDYSSFYGKNVPVLAFFTGLHKDYHRPSDDWELINSKGEEKILKYEYEMIKAIDVLPDKPDFLKGKEEKEQTMTGFRVTVGIMPDYSSNAEGLQILGVRPGGPGEKAGLQAGDIILKLGSHEVKNIYDYTEALGDFKPGDETDVVIKRGAEQLTLKILFTKR
jgi:peptidase M28-like protein/PDZ domain-containing protein/PA domain-containing protein